MSTPQERSLHWQREARIAAGIQLQSHSRPKKSVVCPGSTGTLPTDVVVQEWRDDGDRLRRRVVGKCPVCGRIFSYKPSEAEWIVPRA